MQHCHQARRRLCSLQPYRPLQIGLQLTFPLRAKESRRRLCRSRSQTAARHARRVLQPSSTTSLSFLPRWTHPSAASPLQCSSQLQQVRSLVNRFSQSSLRLAPLREKTCFSAVLPNKPPACVLRRLRLSFAASNNLPTVANAAPAYRSTRRVSLAHQAIQMPLQQSAPRSHPRCLRCAKPRAKELLCLSSSRLRVSQACRAAP